MHTPPDKVAFRKFLGLYDDGTPMLGVPFQPQRPKKRGRGRPKAPDPMVFEIEDPWMRYRAKKRKFPWLEFRKPPYKYPPSKTKKTPGDKA